MKFELSLAKKPLVSGAASDSKRLQVLEDALASARSAGLSVVAEGCDSQADFDMLLALGCSEAQGPCVAGPMDAAGVVAWARTGSMPSTSAVRN